jgi:uncharacterized delta-60 repeat protein
VVAVESDGAVIVATKYTLRRLDQSGQIDQSFGAEGVVTFPSPLAGKFAFGAATVDPEGRIVVVGISTPTQSEDRSVPLGPGAIVPLKAPPRTLVRVLRYLPNGALDSSFGKGGVVETDLGLPTPEVEGTKLASGPVLAVDGVVVDPGGRIVITGSAASGVATECYRYDMEAHVTTTAFVARLTGSGDLDVGFGEGDGVFGGRSIGEIPLAMEKADWPVPTADGGIIFQRGAGSCPSSAGNLGFVRLTPTGAFREASREDSARRVEDATVTPDGSILLLLSEADREGHDSVEKLRPDGSVDRSFGKGGRVVLRLPAESHAGWLRVGPDGEVAIEGIEEPRRPAKTEAKFYEQESIVLVGLHPDGRSDKRFGPRGVHTVRTPHFDGSARPWFDAAGRLTIAASSYGRRGGPNGLVLLRFTL